jgi:hypothetical protein
MHRGDSATEGWPKDLRPSTPAMKSDSAHCPNLVKNGRFSFLTRRGGVAAHRHSALGTTGRPPEEIVGQIRNV